MTFLLYSTCSRFQGYPGIHQVSDSLCPIRTHFVPATRLFSKPFLAPVAKPKQPQPHDIVLITQSSARVEGLRLARTDRCARACARARQCHRKLTVQYIYCYAHARTAHTTTTRTGSGALTPRHDGHHMGFPIGTTVPRPGQACALVPHVDRNAGLPERPTPLITDPPFSPLFPLSVPLAHESPLRLHISLSLADFRRP